VIDATNDSDGTDLDGRTSSELVAELVSSARVVKGANTLVAALLGSDPHQAGGQRVIFLSGDDADAKSEVVKLFEDAGFSAVDLGGLATGGAMQQVGRSACRPQPDPARRVSWRHEVTSRPRPSGTEVVTPAISPLRA